MIQIKEVSKRYGGTLALDRLSLTVPPGAVFGLLGPNGAGKSTLIKMIMGFIYPDRGKIDLGDQKPCRIGYVAERPTFSPRWSIASYLTTMAEVSGLRGRTLRQAVDERLQQVGMHMNAHQLIGACSKGMLQRVALAQALLSDPPIVLLDEPMGGLDPEWQKTTRDVIKDLPQEGRTVVVSTHQLSDVAMICTHVGILNHGKLVRTGSLAQVLPLHDQTHITVDELAEPDCVRLTALHPEIRVQGNVITLSGAALPLQAQVLQLLLDAQIHIRHLAQERATLEEIYLEAMHS